MLLALPFGAGGGWTVWRPGGRSRCAAIRSRATSLCFARPIASLGRPVQSRAPCRRAGTFHRRPAVVAAITSHLPASLSARRQPGAPPRARPRLCGMFCCLLCSRPVRRALGRVTAASPSAKIRRAPVMVVPRNRRPRPSRSTVRPCQGRSATTGCHGGDAVPTAGRTRGQRRRDWWRASRERDGRRKVAGGRRPRRVAAGKMPN